MTAVFYLFFLSIPVNRNWFIGNNRKRYHEHLGAKARKEFINMIEIKHLKYPDDLTDAYTIRKIVFTDEQGVDSELDLDGLDESANHLVAYLDDKAVGTARFRILEDKTAKIERVASLKEVRGMGVGKAVMLELERSLRQLMIEKAIMDAQISAGEFYVKLGYVSDGEEFIEANIPHVKMFKKLK